MRILGQQSLDAVNARRNRTSRQATDVGDAGRVLSLEVEQHDLSIEWLEPVQHLVNPGEGQPIGDRVLRERHGDAWWADRRAGTFLRHHWSTGQKYTAEEVLESVGYAGLDTGPFIEEIEASLSP